MENGKAYVQASFNLALELAEKGARGEKLTDMEKEFVKQSAQMLIEGLIASLKQKSKPADISH